MAKDPADKKTAKVKRLTPLKRDEQNEKRNLRNKAMKSRVNTALRSYEDALKKGDAEATKKTLSTAYSALDKAAQKGVLKKNTAWRTKGRLAARLATV